MKKRRMTAAELQAIADRPIAFCNSPLQLKALLIEDLQQQIDILSDQEWLVNGQVESAALKRFKMFLLDLKIKALPAGEKPRIIQR